MIAPRILHLDDDSFDREIKRRHGPILVEFWAPWCKPCKAIAPTLDEVAEDFAGRAWVAKVNVDEAGDLANRFGVRSVPTLVVFKAGRIVDQMIGNAPKAEIQSMLDRHTDDAAHREANPP